MRLIRLRNSLVSAVVAPDIGGRIISYVVGEHEWLWRNPALLDPDLTPAIPLERLPAPESFATWANFGGDKTWPAPQGWDGPDQWAGPPDGVLDGGAYSVERAGPLDVRLASAVDPVTGLRVRRDIRLAPRSTALTVTSSLTNCADAAAAWSVWEVTQLATAPAAALPDAAVLVGIDRADGDDGNAPAVSPVTRLLDIGPLTYDLTASHIRIPVQDRVGKLGFPLCNGEIRLDLGAPGAFTQNFAVERSAVYPDRGSRAELWMQYPTPRPLRRFPDLHPNAHLVELECLSPLTLLAPGESVALTVTWTVTGTSSSTASPGER